MVRSRKPWFFIAGALVELAARTLHAAQEHGAGDAGEHGASGGMPPFLRFDLPLAFWTIVVFVLLLWVLKRYAWGPILQALNDREKNIADTLARAEQARNEAEQLVGEHRKKLDLVQDEIREILDEARRDAQHTKDEMLAAAQREADETRQRAVRDVERARDQALHEIAQQSAAMITHAAGRVIRASLNEADHRRLIEEALAEFRPDSSN
jgi:F-type H+-transporting ATPase subunit b